MSEPIRTEPVRMTVAEVRDWSDGTDTRHELVDGVLRAMAPPSPMHSRIAGNLAGILYAQLRPPCRVHVEYGLTLETSDFDCFQADLAVVCGEVRRDLPLPDPLLIIEVSSRSTKDHDRGRKVADYKLLPGLACILSVDSDRRRVERWTRDGPRWIVQDHVGEQGTVALGGLDLAIDLAEIYAGVEL